MRDSWYDLLQEFSANFQLKETIFSDLVNAYAHPSRHYHNLEHIQNLLILSELFKENRDNLITLQLSTWFHDYIYNSQAQDNERQSAAYAEKKLRQLNIAPHIIQLVKLIILSTEKHQPLTANINNAIFLDMDLSILGASKDKYLQYSQAIRQEYIWLNDLEYQKARKQVLSNFLARKRIYFTDLFYQKLEAQARNNLEWEIKKIQNSKFKI